MSGPTKIYLVFVAVLALIWAGASTVMGAREPGLRFMTDPDYLMAHAERFTAILRGRVDVRDADGNPVAPPEGTLEVDVRARDAEGQFAVRRIGKVQPDGVFEVLALPHGLATVSILLGGGETVWQAEDVVVGSAGTLDPRIDPIDLGDQLVSFDLIVRGPTGQPVTSGRLAWRGVGAQDNMAFDGIAPIGADGHARFLTTSDAIDAVSLVPGARPELLEELYPDSVLELGPGMQVEVIAGQELPDPDRWRVRVMLVPLDLEPKIEVAREGFGTAGFDSHDRLYGELDLETGRVLIPVARAGRYRLSWGVLKRRGHRFATKKFKDEFGEIVVAMDGGIVRVEHAFPMDAFLRDVANGR